MCIRDSGKRAQPNDRLVAGQKVRIPPLKLDQPRPVSRSAAKDQDDRELLKSITLYEDKDVLIINKPMGLAVQGGSGTKRHVDGLLEALKDDDGQKPRLVHRLDKDTAGCLVIAKTRFAASTMAKSFRARTTRKIYWALVAGVPLDNPRAEIQPVEHGENTAHEGEEHVVLRQETCHRRPGSYPKEAA